MPYCSAVCGVMPNCANTGMPACTPARTASGKSAAPSSLTRSAPPSLTSLIAALTALAAPSCSGPKGKSQLTKARSTPRRTALQTTSISSIVTSSGLEWPHKLTPTESPTETISTPARSAMLAICQATTPTLFRPSRFICKSAGIVTLAAMVLSVCRDQFCPSEFLHPWPQLDLPRPGAAGLMDEVHVGVGDRIGIERAVRTFCRIRPARAPDTTVHHDVRDMDPL